MRAGTTSVRLWSRVTLRAGPDDIVCQEIRRILHCTTCIVVIARQKRLIILITLLCRDVTISTLENSPRAAAETDASRASMRSAKAYYTVHMEAGLSQTLPSRGSSNWRQPRAVRPGLHYQQMFADPPVRPRGSSYATPTPDWATSLTPHPGQIAAAFVCVRLAPSSASTTRYLLAYID